MDSNNSCGDNRNGVLAFQKFTLLLSLDESYGDVVPPEKRVLERFGDGQAFYITKNTLMFSQNFSPKNHEKYFACSFLCSTDELNYGQSIYQDTGNFAHRGILSHPLGGYLSKPLNRSSIDPIIIHRYENQMFMTNTNGVLDTMYRTPYDQYAAPVRGEMVLNYPLQYGARGGWDYNSTHRHRDGTTTTYIPPLPIYKGI